MTGQWPSDGEQETWVDLVFKLEQQLRGQGKSERTVREYVKWSRRLYRWCQLNGEDLATLPAHRLRDWIDQTVPAGRDSRKQAYTTCKHLFTLAGRDDEPWLAIRVPRKRQGNPNPLPDDHAAAVRDAALMVGGRPGLATLGLLYTAARAGEVAGWRWDGVDLEHGTICWWRSKVRDWHYVSLMPVLAAALEQAMPPHAEGFVFIGNGRAHVSANTVWGWVKHVADVSGVPGVSPKRLRATAGSKVANMTGDVQAAARLMGNSVEVAARYYTYVDDRRMTAAMGALNW